MEIKNCKLSSWSKKTYKSFINSQILPFFRKYKLKDITIQDIEQFKLNFVAENGVIPYYAIKKIHNQTIYDTMVQKAGAIINPVFFPLYRG